MALPRFEGSFTQQEPIPDAAIEAATRVMQSGRLHRYNLTQGELGEVSALEAEYAAWQGVPYCLALTSGGQALQIALRAAGVKPGDAVLTNAFTLAPVPGAIHAVGGKPVLVEIDQDLCLDLDDLQRKAGTAGARVMLVSHMRGHLCDMQRLVAICEAHDIKLIEDCAHTMGARWDGKLSGNFGLAGCFSTQTYKHMNSGEGGFLTSNDPDFMARATIMSGSYMLFERHGAGPELQHFADPRYEQPNCSARMDALRASILRPQLPLLEANIARWNDRYRAVADEVAKAPALRLPLRPNQEYFVGSSIQFSLRSGDAQRCQRLVALCAERGVELKWFGHAEPHGFTSNHRSWRYMQPQELANSDAILALLFDMRLPLTFSLEDCHHIGQLIVEAAEAI
jgi:dTDP-4-amino-4,6-dideoxygalactose transaminase